MTPCNAANAGGGSDIQPVKRKHDLVNPATLDCPLCQAPLCPPVFQCSNGPISCSKCCPRIGGQRCHSCSKRTRIRCLAIEDVLEQMEVSCKHSSRGCKEKLKHFQVSVHETRLCQYSGAYQCPVSDCGHQMPLVKLLDHITNAHGGWKCMGPLNASSTTPVMKFSTFSICKGWKKFMIITGTSKKEGASLLLHFEERIRLGVQFVCTSIGVSKVSYNLKVKPRDGSAASYVLETTAHFLKKKGEFSAGNLRQFLLIPTDFEACSKFDVELSFPENG